MSYKTKVKRLTDCPQAIKDRFYRLQPADKERIYDMADILTLRVEGLSMGEALELLCKIGSVINGRVL